MVKTISFKLNGKPTRLKIEGERKLLWVLRTDLGFTGTKYGCGVNQCGACTVIVEKEPVKSCQMPVEAVDGKEVITIEGLGGNGKLHPLQEAFMEHDALQCGFCTPGMLMKAYALLLKNPRPARQEIIESMEDNLCRCGAHTRIIRAIQSATKNME